MYRRCLGVRLSLSRLLAGKSAVGLLALVVLSHAAMVAAEDASAVNARLADAARRLSSDAWEGRGLGTKGLEAAAQYLSEQFAELGLKTAAYDGQPFQRFTVTTSSKLGPADENRLQLVGPPAKDSDAPHKLELKLGQQFTPLAAGGSGKFDLPIAFVGYGITAKDEDYDDYAGLDVDGKAVVILRHEPQQTNPHSAFNGTDNSQHAYYSRKLSNAYEHGAAAVILCTDQHDLDEQLNNIRRRWQRAVDQLAEANVQFKKTEQPTAKQLDEHEAKIERLAGDIQRYSKQLAESRDPLVGFNQVQVEGGGRDFPVLFASRAALDQMIRPALGRSLAELEKKIDEGPKPQSQLLEGWRAVGQTSVQRTRADVKNVVAVLEGEGPHADETIVIGAHYDHLGYGGNGSRSPSSKEIHNGADDNASGTSVLLEVARRLGERQQKLPRRVMLIAFTGEERGLLGSSKYVHDPLVPLEKTIAMLNMDMVGRLRDDKLAIHGTGTAKEFDALVDTLAQEHGFKVTKEPGGFGPSDHASFYGQKIPVLHFFTGSHADYHKPSDDFEKLNIDGMRRVADLVVDCAERLAAAPERPQYVEVKSKTRGEPSGTRPYFGSIPDFTEGGAGYRISGVSKDSPAARGGLKGGDAIVRFGESKIGNLEDFDSALRKHKSGDTVSVVVLRDGKEVELKVTLDPPQ